MRELRRAMAKAAMRRAGYSKINRRMRGNQWRRILGLEPYFLTSGRDIPGNYHGPKKTKKGSYSHLLAY